MLERSRSSSLSSLRSKLILSPVFLCRINLQSSSYIHGLHLPIPLLKGLYMKQLWASTLEHMFLINDTLSGYKEVHADEVSLLTLLCARTGSL